MDIQILQHNADIKPQIDGNKLKLYADIREMLMVTEEVTLTIPTGIGLRLPENIVGNVSGNCIKEFSISGELDLIKLTFNSKSCKSIKPKEFLAEVEFVPKKSEMTFRIERMTADDCEGTKTIL